MSGNQSKSKNTGRSQKAWGNWILGGLALAVLLAPEVAMAQTNWVKLAPATRPSARVGNSMAYDTWHQQVVLYGGTGSGGVFLSDTWTWDGTTWSLQTPGTIPDTRENYCMAYDQLNKRTVIFGGYDNTGTIISSTWLWDGGNWNATSAAISPSARLNCAMTYDEANQQIVMFGGAGGLADTWVWDGVTWLQKSPITVPSNVYGVQSLAFDSARQEVVLVTVELSGSTYSDVTWGWNGTNWSRKTPTTNLPARAIYSVTVYDSALQEVIEFGGQPLPNGARVADTWAWDGSNWAQLSTVTSPPPLAAAPIVYDAARQQAVMFGGNASGVIVADTWVLNASTTAVTIDVPAGVQFTLNSVTYTGKQTINIAPGTYTLAVASPQSAGAGTQLAFQSWSDAGTQSHSVIVGSSALSITGTFQTQYNLAAVASPNGSGSISPSSGYSAAGSVLNLTPTANPNYAFVSWSGDCSGSTIPCSITMDAPKSVTANFTLTASLVTVTVPSGVKFTLNGTTYTTTAQVLLNPGSYTLSTTSPQSTGAGSQAIFVSWSDAGAISHSISVSAGPVSFTGAFQTQYLLTTSASPANEGTVTQTGPGAPGPWYDAGTMVQVQAVPTDPFTFNSWSGACSGTLLSCSVTMNAAKTVTGMFGSPQDWVPVPQTLKSPQLGSVSMAYDSGLQETVLFGYGNNGKGETWVWNGSHWANVSPKVTPSANFLTTSALAYDSARGVIVFFGGFNTNETWEWNGKLQTWTQRLPAAKPPGRVSHMMAYDSARHRVVLFGGLDAASSVSNFKLLNDTWEWDGAAGNWTQLSPVTKPPVRVSGGLAYDEKNQKTILHGGSNGNAIINDTWAWDGVNWVQQNPSTTPIDQTNGRFQGMVYDSTRQNIIAVEATNLTGNPAQDTWAWDGADWSLQHPATAHPLLTGINGLNMAYDAARQEVVSYVSQGNSYTTWVYLVPSVKLVPAGVTTINQGKKIYTQFALQNQGNIPVTHLTFGSATVAGIPITNVSSPTTVANIAALSGSASLTVQLPSNAGPSGSFAIVELTGTYDAVQNLGVPWFAFYAVILP